LPRDFEPAPELVLVHSSDLHVDDDRIAAQHGGDGTAGLGAVLATATALGADILLLAATLRQPHVRPQTIERAGRLLADAGLPIVILPGNHDPVSAESVYARGGFAEIPNLCILGMTHDRVVAFADHNLEIWGNAHFDYQDMVPLRDPHPRNARWHIAIGTAITSRPKRGTTRCARLADQRRDDTGTGADYLALGHWDRAAQVGCGAVPAYYSGSPEYIGTVNLVRLTGSVR